MQLRFLFDFILSIFFPLWIIVLSSSLNLQAIAFNEPFTIEVNDSKRDWYFMDKQIHTKDGMNVTDIDSTKYHSDGTTLNVELWFPSLTELTGLDGRSSVNLIVYGMLIDRDLDETTGHHGIDFQVEIIWDKNTGTWSRHFNEKNAGGYTDSKNITTNYTGFYTKSGHVIKLSVPLKDIYPEKNYRIFVYAYNGKKDPNSPKTLDLVRWIYIPPPEFRLHAISDLETTQNNTKNVEVQINTETGLRPNVTFTEELLSNGVSMKYYPRQLKMDSEEDTTTLKIISKSAEVGQVTIPIKAKVTFPSQYLDSSVLANTSKSIIKSFTYVIPSQTIYAEQDRNRSSNITRSTVVGRI